MPDLMIVHVRTCASNLRWSKQYPSGSRKNIMHTVVFGPSPGGRYACDYSCNCEAGKRGLTCRHIKQAAKERCGWNWEAFCGSFAEPNPDGTCPACGGPTEVIKVGV